MRISTLENLFDAHVLRKWNLQYSKRTENIRVTLRMVNMRDVCSFAGN